MKTHLAYKKKNLSLGVSFQILKDHDDISDRFKKTLYYGKSPKIDRPSLSLTDLSVHMFSKAVPSDHLGFIDMEYASQVGRNACISPCSMMLAMVYIERLRCKNPDYIQNISSSDLFLVSMMIATKFLNDEGEDDEVFNGEWAASANMDNKDLNKLEREFLAAIDWDLFVNPADFADVMRSVETRVALLEGQKRGWYSYTDLDILARNVVFSKNWKLIKENVLKVITICSVAYAAAICVLVGSTALISGGIRSSYVSRLLIKNNNTGFSNVGTRLPTMEHANSRKVHIAFDSNVVQESDEMEWSLNIDANDSTSNPKDASQHGSIKVIPTNTPNLNYDSIHSNINCTNRNCGFLRSKRNCSEQIWKDSLLSVRKIAVCF